jgi:hypothetical protein
MNLVTLRNTNLPPSTNKISEEFTRYIYISLIDFFSGYNQLILDTYSRDLTVFIILLGLLRITILF